MFSPGSDSPMMVGSPGGGGGTPGNLQSPYLPSYLLGEPPSALKSTASPRLWGTPSGYSPPKSVKSPSSSGGVAGIGGASFSTPRTDYSQRKDKTAAPPVQGLYDQITTPGGAASSPFHGHNQPDFNSSQLNSSSIYNRSINRVPQTGLLFNNAPPQTVTATASSPTQIDPFYTQGEAITPDEVLNETWVTIFGFPPAATSFILQQFSQYGNILNHVISAEGNWMHIQYQSKIQAKKALSKNGKVFGNGIMVGVQMCIDVSVMNVGNQCNQSNLNTPITGARGTPIGGAARGTPIRPLTAAYIAASSDHQVTNQCTTPQKNSGIIGKAMEYMFGW
ncbi:nucleoporin NUP35-like [Tubulanus polymorphus]|uniref:nucleoporin NUP35-like n=1 Tax=Tubulanus polymorphus TaxID=672921 RepID=UPI003DA38CEB